MGLVTREQKIEQSVQDYLSVRLEDTGYTTQIVEMLDAYPDDEMVTKPMARQAYVALMWNFDDGGNAVECGSDLTRYEHVVEAFVFGRSDEDAQNVATTVKALLNIDRRVPLKDIAVVEQPTIDYLPLITVAAMRQLVNQPRLWERFLWTVTIRLEDEFYASA